MNAQYLLENDGIFTVMTADKLRKHLENVKPFTFLYRLIPNNSPQQLLVWRLNSGVWMVTDTFKNMIEI